MSDGTPLQGKPSWRKTALRTLTVVITALGMTVLMLSLLAASAGSARAQYTSEQPQVEMDQTSGRGVPDLAVPPIAPQEAITAVLPAWVAERAGEGIRVLAGAELEIHLTAPEFVYNGDHLAYTLTLINNSTGYTATNIQMWDELPASPRGQIQMDQVHCLFGACELVVEWETITTPLGTPLQVTVVTEVKWDIPGPPLGPGQSISRTFSGRVIGQADDTLLTNKVYAFYEREQESDTLRFSESNETATIARVRVESLGRASLSDVPTWLSSDHGGTLSLDWGDFDRDGDLDLALGSTAGTTVYENVEGRLEWFWDVPRYTLGVRWGDVAPAVVGLELIAVGESIDNSAVQAGTNYVYRLADNGAGFQEHGSFASDFQLLRVEAADLISDADHYIDLVASTNAISTPCAVLLYENTGGSGHFGDPPQCVSKVATANIAPGDYNNDDLLDLAVGLFPNQIWLAINDGTTLSVTKSHAVIDPSTSFLPYDFAWGDYDGDGWLDLAAAFPLGNKACVYRNLHGAGFQRDDVELATGQFYTPLSVEWADLNGDALLDLAVADAPPKIYFNTGDKSHPLSPTVQTSLLENVVDGQIWALATADPDQDGDLDLTLGDRDGASLLFTVFAPLLKTTIDPVGDARQARSIAWGDVDGNGYLDLLFGASTGAQSRYSWLTYNQDAEFGGEQKSREPSPAARVAFGDVNGDNSLDIALGTLSSIQVYLGHRFSSERLWSVPSSSAVQSLAWGDAEGDGDLDLLVGTNGHDLLYLNAHNYDQGELLSESPHWTSVEAEDTRSVAWGDYDGDGYTDFAVGIYGGANRIYHNDGAYSFTPIRLSPYLSATTSVAWADYDGDGDLDLAVGNYAQPNMVYENIDGTFGITDAWQSKETSRTVSLAWGDWDNDGDPDLAVGNDGEPDQVYANRRSSSGPPEMTWLWASAEAYETTAVAWGDRDRDGDLDLAISQAGIGGRNGVYANTYVMPSHLPGIFTPTMPLPNNPSYLVITRPGETPAAYYHSSAELLAGPVVTIQYRLHDPDGTRKVAASDSDGDQVVTTTYEYSLDGGGTWRPATFAAADPYTVPQSPPYTSTTKRLGQERYFQWDVVEDEAISDSALFRITVGQLDQGGSTRRASASAVSPPFRVRATTCVWPEGPSIRYTWPPPKPDDPDRPEPTKPVRFEGAVWKGEGVLTFGWDFGDGEVGQGQVMQHAYDQSGVYDIVMTVTSIPCPVARTVTATARITIGTGVPSIYLPLILKSSASAATHGADLAASAQGAERSGAAPALWPFPSAARASATLAPLPKAGGEVRPASNALGEGSISGSEQRLGTEAVRAEQNRRPRSTFTRLATDQLVLERPPVLTQPGRALAAEIPSTVQNVFAVTLDKPGIHSEPTIDGEGDRIAFWSTGDLGATRASYQYANIPPILLVDDGDSYSPGRQYYGEALGALGYSYEVWRTRQAGREPDAAKLKTHHTVIWFTGDDWNAGPDPAGQAALQSFLDEGAGKCLFMSSQDLYWNRPGSPPMSVLTDQYFGAHLVQSNWVQSLATNVGCRWGVQCSLTGCWWEYNCGLDIDQVRGVVPPSGLSVGRPIDSRSDWIVPSRAQTGIALEEFVSLSTWFGPVAGAREVALYRNPGGYKTTLWAFPFEGISDPGQRREAMRWAVETYCQPRQRVPTVVVNEVLFSDGLSPAEVELYNYGASEVTIGSPWRLRIKNAGGAPYDHSFLLPITLKPGSYGTIPLDGAFALGSDGGSVSLTDDWTRGVDFVHWGSSTEEPPNGTTWSGGSANLASFVAGETLQRGDDTNQAEDWCAGIPTLGAKNWGCDESTNPDGNIEIFLADLSAITAFTTTDTPSFIQASFSEGSILAGFSLGPSINDDGTRVAFFSDRELDAEMENRESNFEIFVYDTSGSIRPVTQLTDTAGCVNLYPSMDAAGDHIAYVSTCDPDGNQEIFVAQISPTLHITQVTHTPSGVSNDQPEISADGTHVVYVSNSDPSGTKRDNAEIYVAQISPTLRITRVTCTTVDNRHPTADEHGQLIAFARDGQIHVVTSDLSGHCAAPETRIGIGTGTRDEQPSLSRDGKRLVYIGDNTIRLAFINSPGASTAIAATADTDRPSHVAISGDGTRVVYAAGNQIYLVKVNVTNLSVEKSASVDLPNHGDLLIYTVTIANNGHATATAVVVTDTFPSAHVDVIGHDPSIGTYDPASGRWEGFALSSGENATLVISGLVTATSGTTITNRIVDATTTTPDEDLSDNSASVTVTVNITPTAVDDERTITEDSGPTAIYVTADDRPPEPNDWVHVVAVGDPVSGTEIIGAVGISGTTHVVYTPANRSETYTVIFTYTIRDKSGLEDTGTVTVHVIADNDPPDAVDDPDNTTDEDIPLPISVLDNDWNDKGEDLIIVSVTDPVRGTAGISGTQVVYTPVNRTADYTVTFAYTIRDSIGQTDTANVTVTVTTSNDPPDAVDDPDNTTDEETALPISVLDNDWNDEGESVTVTSVTDPVSGTTVISGTQVLFTPTGAFDYLNVSDTDTVTFSYTIQDAIGQADTATVTVTVSGVNDPPVATDATRSTDEGSPGDPPFAIPLADVVDDPDDAIGSLSVAVSPPSPDLGATGVSGPQIVYTPANRTTGYTVTFTYIVTDSGSLPAGGTITIAVTADNDPPDAVDDPDNTTDEDASISIPVLGNDWNDEDEDPLTVTSVTDPARGAVGTNGTQILFTPVGAFDYLNVGGTDAVTFSYTVQDGVGQADSATVTVTVTGVNDPPVAADATRATDEGSPGDPPFAIPLADIVDDPDDALASLSVAVSPPSPDLGATGVSGTQIVYTPANRTTGYTVTFTYVVTDSGLESAGGTLTVAVTADNDTPDAVDDPDNTTNEDTSLIIDVLANDWNDEGENLMIASVTGPVSGSAAISGTEILFSPVGAFDHLNVGDTGTATFSYTIQDSIGQTDTAAVTVAVTGVNDPPTAVDDRIWVYEDSGTVSLEAILLANDTDPDGGDSRQIVDKDDTGTLGVVTLDVAHNLTYTASGFDWLAQGITTTDGFTYSMEDGSGERSSAAVTVIITGVNDPPAVTVNAPITVVKSATATISSGYLEATDPDNVDPAEIIFTLATTPTLGTLLRNGTALSQSDTFTQEDIDQGGLSYAADNAPNKSDSFQVTVADVHGATNGMTYAFAVSIIP